MNTPMSLHTATWLCRCGTPADTLMVMWITDHPIGRPVAGDVTVTCQSCAAGHNSTLGDYHRKPDHQWFSNLRLTTRTKAKLVGQILAQVIGQLRGYLPRTDLAKAISALAKDRAPGRETR
jgi:hypothetical protein